MADVPAGGYFFTGTKGPKFFIRSERSKRPDNLCLRFYNSGRFLGFSWDVCLKLMPYFLFGSSRNLKNIIIHTNSFLSFHSGVWKNYKEKKNSSYNFFSIFCNQVKIKTFSQKKWKFLDFQLELRNFCQGKFVRYKRFSAKHEKIRISCSHKGVKDFDATSQKIWPHSARFPLVESWDSQYLTIFHA